MAGAPMPDDTFTKYDRFRFEWELGTVFVRWVVRDLAHEGMASNVLASGNAFTLRKARHKGLHVMDAQLRHEAELAAEHDGIVLDSEPGSETARAVAADTLAAMHT